MRARTLRELTAIVRAAAPYRLELGTELDSVRRAVEAALAEDAP